MPEQGQYVNYTAQGICRVEGIESLKFGDGKARDYYLLRPVNQPESSVYLPVDNPDLLANSSSASGRTASPGSRISGSGRSSFPPSSRGGTSGSCCC